MRIPSALAAALLLAPALAAVDPAAARAASGSGGAEVTASLTVVGARGCVTRADLIARIARRSARIRIGGEGGAVGPALRAAVESVAPGTTNVALSFVWPGGARSDRRLTARNCAEAADALALVIVLALDPGAAARAPPPSPAAPPPSPAAPPFAGSAPPPSAATIPASPPPSAAPVRPPPPAATARPPPSPSPLLSPAAGSPDGVPETRDTPAPSAAVPPSPPPAPPAPGVSRFAVGAGGRATSGPAPRLLTGLALVLAWELDRDSFWAPAVQLVASRYARAVSDTSGGSATFGLDLVGVQLCPLRVGSGALGLRLCAGAAGGRLVARGGDTFNARSRSRPFVTAGGAALLALAPHPRVELAFSVEPAAALVRDRFAFDPNVFYAVPRLILTLGVGVVLKFP